MLFRVVVVVAVFHRLQQTLFADSRQVVALSLSIKQHRKAVSHCSSNVHTGEVRLGVHSVFGSVAQTATCNTQAKPENV